MKNLSRVMGIIWIITSLLWAALGIAGFLYGVTWLENLETSLEGNLQLIVDSLDPVSEIVIETTHVVGDISGKRPIIIDDLMAGGSVLKQVNALYEHGAEGKAVFSITHPVLLPSALKILASDDRIEKLITTNTIPVPQENRKKVDVLSVAPMLAEIISRVHRGVSISEKLILA